MDNNYYYYYEWYCTVLRVLDLTIEFIKRYISGLKRKR